MNEICISILVVAVLVTVAKEFARINRATMAAREHVRKIQVQDARIREQVQRLRERDEAKADRAALREARLAEQHNRVMLQEIKIEIEAVKLKKLKDNLGDPDLFAPPSEITPPQ